MACFDNGDDLKFRGFGMIAILREAYTSTDYNSIFPNFLSLLSLK